jgi:hypothetical protein
LSGKVVIGNAARDAEPFRGWLVGHFVAREFGLRSSDAVEVKWGVHALGDRRASWAVGAKATSLSVLVHGCIRLIFASGQEALLTTPGDYALWPPGLAHRWQIEQDDTVVVTVRWPSVPEQADEA